MKLIVIGCGNMGTAMVNAMSNELLFDDIEVYDRSGGKYKVLGDVTMLESLEETFIDEETTVLIAVKPQDIDEVLGMLKGRLVSETLLISIAAGVSIERLQKGAECDAVVRVMPNTPATVGKGMSAWFASPAASKEHCDLVRAMLSSFGMELEVFSEDDIDKVTALSGSGPAYFFYFLEALIAGGKALGIPEDQALKLAVQTVVGGAKMASRVNSLSDLEQLRANVTSKGGTTERAIGVFDERSLKSVVSDAMKAAYDRAKEL